MAAVTPEPTPASALAGQAKAGLSGMGKIFAGFKEFVSRGMFRPVTTADPFLGEV